MATTIVALASAVAVTWVWADSGRPDQADPVEAGMGHVAPAVAGSMADAPRLQGASGVPIQVARTSPSRPARSPCPGASRAGCPECVVVPSAGRFAAPLLMPEAHRTTEGTSRRGSCLTLQAALPGHLTFQVPPRVRPPQVPQPRRSPSRPPSRPSSRRSCNHCPRSPPPHIQSRRLLPIPAPSEIQAE